MNSNHLDPLCDGCGFSLGNTLGSNVRLPGSWCLNHYGGSEGYLGWLALQPYWHRATLSQLSTDELFHLGPNIIAVERSLSEYWTATFDDPIEKLYVIYFLEGGGHHVHIHLIPRFRSLDLQFRDWNIPRATTSEKFPVKYRRDNRDFESRVIGIMDHLRINLVTKSKLPT